LTTERGSATLRLVLLILTTIRRLALLLVVFLIWTPAAYAWSWPVQGPVLQPFSYDESHPYASGQHRGIDIGVDAAGEAVLAPAAGTVSFAGTVGTNGKTITVETADGYSVTLTHLGSIAVAKGATVAEQDAVGTIGPSGTPEVDRPYVHLGIRVTDDPNGYVDPLGLLPPASSDAATETTTTTTTTTATTTTTTTTTASQPAPSGAGPVTRALKPASSAPKSTRVATTRRAEPARSHVRTRQQERVRKPPSNARTSRPAYHHAVRDRATPRTSSTRRPVVEPLAPKPIGLDADHQLRPPVSVQQPRREPSSRLPTLLCDGAEAVFALALMLAASRRRRRSSASSTVSAQVLHLPCRADEQRHMSRVA
jgi:hypothetical protein